MSLHMDLVSVIVPTYNRFKYLQHTLRSIQAQTYPNLEIIVVNDGSTEKAYYEHHWKVRILHLETNSKERFGYACAGYVRNKGIEAATGKYIAFCDDDDSWFPEKIELQLLAMEYTGCKMSSTDGLLGKGIYDPTQVYPKYNAEANFETLNSIYRGALVHGFPERWTKAFLQVHNCVICSSVLIEKAILDKIQNMKHVPNGEEDYDCWLRALDHTDSVYVTEPCFYYDLGHGDGQMY